MAPSCVLYEWAFPESGLNCLQLQFAQLFVSTPPQLVPRLTPDTYPLSSDSRVFPYRVSLACFEGPSFPLLIALSFALFPGRRHSQMDRAVVDVVTNEIVYKPGQPIQVSPALLPSIASHRVPSTSTVPRRSRSTASRLVSWVLPPSPSPTRSVPSPHLTSFA